MSQQTGLVILNGTPRGVVIKEVAVIGKLGWGGAIPSGGTSALADLSDVDVSGVTNGESLIYNSSTEKWEPGSPSVGSSTDADAQLLAWLGL